MEVKRIAIFLEIKCPFQGIPCFTKGRNETERNDTELGSFDEIGETTNKMTYPRIKTDLPTPPLQRKNLISYIYLEDLITSLEVVSKFLIRETKHIGLL
jgi:hypothetical protein